MIHVYTLRDTTGIIYVGVSGNLNTRLYHHTVPKPNKAGHGKFHGRRDITIHLESSYTERKVALKEEKRLKLELGMVWGEAISGRTNCKNMRVLTKDIAEEIRSKYIPKIYHMKMLAEEYNVSKSTVQRILENKTYMNV